MASEHLMMSQPMRASSSVWRGMACEINALDRVRACWPLSDSIDHTNGHSRITRDLSIHRTHRVVRESARARVNVGAPLERSVLFYTISVLWREKPPAQGPPEPSG